MRALIALIAGTLVTTAAVAYDTGDKDQSKSADTKFQKLDRDNDGRVSEQESPRDETLSAQFAALDRDSDGFLNRSEYTAMNDAQKDMQRQDTQQRTPSDYDRTLGAAVTLSVDEVRK
jgi:Ca2+-binding EF-hand superfamily protein